MILKLIAILLVCMSVCGASNCTEKPEVKENILVRPGYDLCDVMIAWLKVKSSRSLEKKLKEKCGVQLEKLPEPVYETLFNQLHKFFLPFESLTQIPTLTCVEKNSLCFGLHISGFVYNVYIQKIISLYIGLLLMPIIAIVAPTYFSKKVDLFLNLYE